MVTAEENELRTLHDGWSLKHAGARIPASVPGCVHTDLLRAGVIDDPYRAGNEEELGWIGRRAWRYETAFTWEPSGHERADLCCEGLDTVATVELNGVVVGESANMHRTYRFPVRELLKPGENRLAVTFHSPYAYAEEQRARLGHRPSPYAEPYPFIRKMACNFGWDWGPTLVTSGIWRPIGLAEWSGVRLAAVRPRAYADGRVVIDCELEQTGGEPEATLTAEIAGVTAGLRLAPGQREARLELQVDSPCLWWPRGYGEQPLYELTVRAGDDRWTRGIGFRDIDLDPEAFRLTVNGVQLFAKGFNWIPDDCFPARVTPGRLRERFGQAVEVGANLLRVWGGGLYESDEFYSLADSLGLLVWQDFPFACAAYPEEEPFWSEVEAEARQNVTRLMSHPSLALWCGNNENIEGHRHWGWPAELAGRSWGAGYYYDLLRRVTAELDPARPYLPGSPYSGSPEADPNDPARGPVHIWTVWNERDYTGYDAYTPRFVAEFGFQGPPAYATLRRASDDRPLTPDSSPQKAEDGQAKLLRGLGGHLPSPATFDDWHYLTQLNQARAVRYGVERFRSLMPYCMGAVVWQLNDCWPVTSWAAVDGDGRRKPLWYGLRRAFAPRLLTFQHDALAVVNDTPDAWTGTLALARLGLDGATLATAALPVTAAPRSAVSVPLPAGLAAAGDPARELLTAELDGGSRAIRFFAEDPEVDFPRAAFDAALEPAAGGARLSITARTLLRDLAVFPDRLDPEATVDEQLVTLLPGETASFHVTTGRRLALAELIAKPVLRCVND